MARTKVFISYSHEDADWLGRLRVNLAPLERRGLLEVWDDTRLAPGDQWRSQIEGALASARIAVLLVSADFLASEFIQRHELPRLLARARQDGLRVMPLIVRPSLFSEVPELSQFQAFNPPGRPLSTLRKAEREQVLVDVARAIGEALDGAASPPAEPRPPAASPSLLAAPLASPPGAGATEPLHPPIKVRTPPEGAASSALRIRRLLEGYPPDSASRVFEVVIANESDHQVLLMDFDLRWRYQRGQLLSTATGMALTPVARYVIDLPVDPETPGSRQRTEPLYPPVVAPPRDAGGPSLTTLGLQLHYSFEGRIQYHPEWDWDILVDLSIRDDRDGSLPVLLQSSWHTDQPFDASQPWKPWQP